VGWDAEARVTRTLDPAMSVAWGGRDVRLRLGARTGWAFSSTLRVPVGAVLETHLGFTLERRAFGASPRDAATGLVEPRSETEQAALELGVGARF
jgi:hypothetical protein